MDPVVPQDEYFEWEDIMAYQTVREDRDENLLLQSESVSSCTWKIESVGVPQLPEIQQSEKARSMAPPTTLHSLRASLTLDTSSLGINSTESTPTRNSPIIFPSYAEFGDDGSSFLIENFASDAENFEITQETMDDISLYPDPSRHVDYLSHDWDEEDIWATWKRLQAKRQSPNVAERLENATWRAWSKVRLNLKTVSPESFNWMKDLDDTWLYGPFHGSISRTTTFKTAFSNDAHSTHTTLAIQKTRSILKRPRLSEVLLRGAERPGNFRSKSVELDSRPFYDSSTKKRVVFREEVEQYAAVHHIDEEEKDELDHWTETYSSKYSYDDPVEDLLSKTQTLRHHVEQNIKILENYRTPPSLPTRKTLEKLPPAPLKCPNDNSAEDSEKGKATSSPTRHHNEPLRFSTLSEWTLLGGDSFDEEEDWLSPSAAPYTNFAPTIPPSSDITSSRPSLSLNSGLNPSTEPDLEIRDELTALMRCEAMFLESEIEPSSCFSEPSSASDTNSNSSCSSEERDQLNHVIVRDVEGEGEIKGLMAMKQAFVDRVMEDFYLGEKEEEGFCGLVPPELRLGTAVV